MTLALDVIRAQHGDCLLLHYGKNKRILIDGGPSPVWRKFLEPHLASLRGSSSKPLPIEMVIVSHIDDDHIGGLLRMTRRLIDEDDNQQVPLLKVKTLWHNAFDDVIGNTGDEIGVADTADITASLGGLLPPDELNESAVVLASVSQGRRLRDDARRLGWKINDGFSNLVRFTDSDQKPIDVGNGLKLRVIGPDKDRLEKLAKNWDKYLKKLESDKQKERIKAAAYLDDSVANLSSIVILAEHGKGSKKKRMLFTGDARGDYIIDGLERAGLLDSKGKIHVDLLKIPHHGSDHNVEPEFFETISADHYVVSGDGRHGNPEVETLRWLIDSRKKTAKYTIHMTYAPEDFIHHYPIAELKQLLKPGQRKFKAQWPKSGDRFSEVELVKK